MGSGVRRTRTFGTVSCWVFGKPSLHWYGTVLGPAVCPQCSIHFDRLAVLSLRLTPVIPVFGGGRGRRLSSSRPAWATKKPCGSWETLSGQAAYLRSHSKSRDGEPGSGRGHCGRLSMVPLMVAFPIDSLRDRTESPREPGQSNNF